MDGPASHAIMPPSEAVISMMPRIGVSHSTWKWVKKAVKACITPPVRVSSLDGTTQLMARAGRTKIATTIGMAMNMALGNSLPGFFMFFTWTAFTSMPAYDRKLLTMSTRLASPANCGSRWLTFIGAAEWLPWMR